MRMLPSPGPRVKRRMDGRVFVCEADVALAHVFAAPAPLPLVGRCARLPQSWRAPRGPTFAYARTVQCALLVRAVASAVSRDSVRTAQPIPRLHAAPKRQTSRGQISGSPEAPGVLFGCLGMPHHILLTWYRPQALSRILKNHPLGPYNGLHNCAAQSHYC